MASRKCRHSASLMSDTESLMVDHHIEMSLSDLENDDPPLKKQKMHSDLLEFTSDHGTSADQSLRSLLLSLQTSMCQRMDRLEEKVNNLVGVTEQLQCRVGAMQHTVDQLAACLQQNQPRESDDGDDTRSVKSSQEIALNFSPSTSEDSLVKTFSAPRLNTNVTLITLNREDDYPNGSWLGDKNNLEMRVRVPVSPTDLFYIHSNCRTPEKMALTLLDYLFDRETQASSNLSGLGKHGKQQLDPLFIYGIRCHLIDNFQITDADWHRIKHNIDSKCRTAFRRKVRGQPLTVKAFQGVRGRSGQSDHLKDHVIGIYDQNHIHDLSSCQSDEDSMQHCEEIEFEMLNDSLISLDSGSAITSGQLIPQGKIKLVQATPQQVAQLQYQTHQIRIVSGDQIFCVQPTTLGDEAGGLHLVNEDESLITAEAVTDTTIDGDVLKFESSSQH